ncbi:adenylosuccinate lyase [Flagellimonas marina]|uniref:Adenylosuccinate lyase n=1 Tax=Flagellimonas marina TaxID=1775168 RepID=A0ABV8PI91_9FLAO
MTEQQLHIALHSGRLFKDDVDQLVDKLILQPNMVGPLLKEVLIEEKEGTYNASWTFRHLIEKKLDYLLPFFDDFTEILGKLTSESTIRAMACVCEMVCVAYFKKKDPAFQNNISDEQLERIMTACFDWLISEMNMAPKVFSMTSLYYLGQKFDWVHPELRQVLEDTYASGSTGYKNRAKKTLDKLAQIGR